jgi:hypothetical protein
MPKGGGADLVLLVCTDKQLCAVHNQTNIGLQVAAVAQARTYELMKDRFR